MRGILVFLCATQWAGAAAAPPAIRQHGVVNAASLMPPTLAGGAIAPGSMFRIEGPRLGPSDPVRAEGYPLPASLGGVTVDIEQAGRRCRALLLDVAATHILAILPQTAPLGTVQLTVSFNGQTSVPYDLKVAPGSFGIFSDNLLGRGPGVIERPAEGIAALWGTGLGTASPEVFVGGMPARVRQAGRSECCEGVDRIVFEIPAAAPRGCFVPVLVRVSPGVVSNMVTMPISNGQGPCVDPANWLRAPLDARRTGFAVLLRAWLKLDLDPDPSAKPVEFLFDTAMLSFGVQSDEPKGELPPLGACSSYTGRFPIGVLIEPLRGGRLLPLLLPQMARLDAGPAILLRGPNRRVALRGGDQGEGSYSALLGGNPPLMHRKPAPPFLDPGTYSLESSGGRDAGPFHVQAPVRRRVEWVNKRDAGVVDRSKGLTIVWKGAGKNQTVVLAAFNNDPLTAATGLCACLVRGEAGSFTIPSHMLANIPPTVAVQDIPASLLLVGAVPARGPAEIKARGLDAGLAFFVSIDGASVVYK